MQDGLEHMAPLLEKLRQGKDIFEGLLGVIAIVGPNDVGKTFWLNLLLLATATDHLTYMLNNQDKSTLDRLRKLEGIKQVW